MTRRCQHHDPANWFEVLAGHVLRTTCKRCGAFIGYRPREAVKRKRGKRTATDHTDGHG